MSIKRIGREFRLLAPKAEHALIPVWLAIAEKIVAIKRNCDTIFWTTDYLSGTLAVRWIDSADEDVAFRNVLLYSTPSIAEAIRVMEQILGNRFSDEALREFQSVYELWIDHVLRVSFESPQVQAAFRKTLLSRKPLSIIATTVDEGLAGKVRIVWQSKAAKTKAGDSIAKSSQPPRKAQRKRAIINRKTKR